MSLLHKKICVYQVQIIHPKNEKLRGRKGPPEKAYYPGKHWLKIQCLMVAPALPVCLNAWLGISWETKIGLVDLCFHVHPQDSINSGLIAFALVLKPFQNVRIKTD